jgi:hypothetical protein
MDRLAVASLILFTIPLLSMAQESPNNKPVAKLIEELGDKDFKVRESAARAIDALGAEALPELRKAVDHPDVEIRRRVAKWIPQLELAAFVAPKRVTLNITNQSLEKAINELTRQTGYTIVLPPNADNSKPCTFRCDHLPFWEALDRICQDGKLAILDAWSVPNGVTLTPNDGVRPPVAYHGAFRLTVERIEYRKETAEYRTIILGPVGEEAERKDAKSAATENVYIQVGIRVEPRLRIFSMIEEPFVSQAIDNEDHSLPAEKNDQDSLFRRGPRWMGNFDVNLISTETIRLSLRPSKEQVRTLKLLRGTLPVTLEKEKKTIVVSDNLEKARGKSVKVDGATIQIDSFIAKPEQNRYSLAWTVAETNRDAAATPRAMPFLPCDREFELQDSQGNRFEQQSGGSAGGGEGIAEYHYIFAPSGVGKAVPLGPPTKLVMVKTVPLVYHIPFEFKDLRLP